MTLYSTDRDVLHTAIDWLSADHSVALVTVARTWGSSPRPRGSLLIMRDDGVHAGSVSGGCVEEDLVNRFQRGELAQSYPTLVDYGVNRQDALRFGLPCGGRLELVVELLASASQLQVLLSDIDSGYLVARRVCLNTGEVSLHRDSSVTDFRYTESEVIKVFGPAWHMLIIGAGHLSRYVASIAIMLDYHITVCDPREEYQQGWDIPGVSMTRSMPDDAVNTMTSTTRGVILTLTHDPKLDDMALMEALQTDFFYVGALGSRLSSKKRKNRLLEMGVTATQLEKLHAPVGLAIGSHTPPEIAVAIMAEITMERNKSQQTSASLVTP